MKPTLAQVFMLSLLGLAAALGLLFFVVFGGSRATIIESSERIRDAASHEISGHVTAFLAKAPDAVRQVQMALSNGLVDPQDPISVEGALYAALFRDPDIGEITLTYGRKLGFSIDGAIELAPEPRGQVTVARAEDADGRERSWSRHVRQEGGAFVSDRRQLEHSKDYTKLPLVRESSGMTPDPTAHLTFTTPASRSFYGDLLPSDLHWSQLDAGLQESQRRVEVSVQQVVSDADGNFAGVLRVGLLARQLDRAVHLRIAADPHEDPHRIFLCDAQGRLITRGVSSDDLQEADGDLRVAPDAVPEPIASALAGPQLRAISTQEPLVSGRFSSGGADYLATFRMLPGTQDWIVGIVVPRSFYLGKLVAMRDRLLAISLAIIAVLVAGGSLILRSVRGAQSRITRESAKMNAFEFSPAPTNAPFRDVSDVLESLEKAKTAMRAMGKYAPIDLVRRLYRERSEPALGGQEIEVSTMFTDIKNFTTLAERLAPNELASALGLYLERMARIIQQETKGTIDKFIGDAIMAFWNAPEEVLDHPRMACLAALRCRDAGRALAESPDWRGLPPFETRFGLHRGVALVGHFGAPDRMNYTAIGDAINLASRLEGLNKQYGTAIIASEGIVEEAREHFDFRLLDFVAVKGKSAAIRIYELLGEKGAAWEPDLMAAYERGFEAYIARDFNAAIAILGANIRDEPSAVLLQRCRRFLAEPPPADWNGTHFSETK